MATTKQISFIEALMEKKDCSALDSFEFKAAQIGQVDELSDRQASQLIDDLMNCPDKVAARLESTPATKQIGDAVEHPKFGAGIITKIHADMYTIKFNGFTKQIAAGFVK